MKILVTGGGGMLGTEFRALAERAGLDLIALPRAAMDVTDPEAVRAGMEAYGPEAVVHAAAYTAVDRAESEPDRARRVNVEGSAHVASAAAAAGARVVYVSTDFVFPGTSWTPYAPGDPTGPASVYGRTKLAGEDAVRRAAQDHLVVRTSWVYGAGGGNFVDAILRRARTGAALRVVDDQHGRPTWARDLAEGIVALIRADARGTLHLSGGGPVVTWCEVARTALRLAGLDVPVEPVTTEAWGAPAPRPRYSALDCTAAEAVLGEPLRPWPVALAGYLSGRTP